jgi:hypothetical protein
MAHWPVLSSYYLGPGGSILLASKSRHMESLYIILSGSSLDSVLPSSGTLLGIGLPPPHLTRAFSPRPLVSEAQTTFGFFDGGAYACFGKRR